jgi:hypothetical protein
LVRANDRGIEQNPLFVELHLEALEDGLPVTSPRPQRETIVDRLPGSEPLRQVSPRNAGLESIENRVDEEAVAQHRSRTATTRKHSRQQVPLSISQSMSLRHIQL